MINRILAICAILATGLAGCASGSSQADSSAEPAANLEAGAVADASAAAQAPRLSAGGEFPLQTQLVIGTFSLEQSELAVSAEQARDLLPLWKALQSLNNSDTAAQAEIDALIEQIQEAMTPAQIDAMADLEVTSQNLAEVVQELGIQTQLQGQLRSSAEEGGASGPPGGGGFTFGEGGGPGGPGPGGGPPAGGGFVGGPGGAVGGLQGTPDPDQIATLEASGAGGGLFGERGGSFLIPALIELLEQRAATEA